MNLPANVPWLLERARLEGDRAALHFEGEALTWSALAAQSLAVAGRLSKLGVGRGDIVALRMPPHPRFVAILHAVQMIGAALLPLNLRLAAPERARILAHARPRLVIDSDAQENADGSARVHASGGLAGVMDVARFADSAGLADAPATNFEAPAAIDPDAPLTIVYTSGTTAVPKGVVLTNANYEAAAEGSRRRLGHDATDTWLASLPLFHVGGLAILARSVLDGSQVLLEDGFDIERVVSVLERGEATMVSLVPTMLVRVLDHMTTRASSRVRCVLVGGASLSPSIGRRALEAGLPISATYGMTEACSQICSSAPGSDDAAIGLVGRPLDGMEVRIDHADAHGWGGILVRGAAVTRGYLDNGEADDSVRRDGWLATGDIGRLDGQGVLEVSGRRSDLIVTGGENVAPVEVEHVLDEHPCVAESLVTGVEDAQWGQRVVALVVAHEGATVEAPALLAWCRERLAAYKLPREFRFVNALPRGATGKLLR